MSFGKPDSMPALTRYEGVDSRPTLLRVLTDLYVQKPAHSAEEERHYTELALRLVDVVDLATRKTVADRLVRYPAAPLAVIQRLAHDIFEFTKLELGHAAADLRAIAKEPKLAAVAPPPRPHLQARSLGTTRSEPQDGSEAVAAVPGTLTARLFAERKPAEPAPGLVRADPEHAGLPQRPSATPAMAGTSQASAAAPSGRQLGEQFYALDGAERRLMLVRLGATSDLPSAAIKPRGDVCARLEAAALSGQPDVFIGELERALDMSRAEAQRIVNDTSGEPVAVAGKALGMSIEMLQRILLFLNPAVGRSVERLYSLTALYGELRAEAALRLVSSWRSTTANSARIGRHQPVHWDDERRSARDGATHAARRPLPAPNAATERPPGPYSVGGRHRTI